MEGEKKSRVYIHVGRANRVKVICTNGHLLNSIWCNLPQALIYVVLIKAEDENDGAKFFTAVHSIQIEKVVGKAKESAAMRDLEERVAAMSGFAPSPHTAFPLHTKPEYNHQHTYIADQAQQSVPPMPQHGTAPQPPQIHHQPNTRVGYNRPPHMRTAYGPTTPAPYGQRGQLLTPNRSSPNPFGDTTTRRHNVFTQQLQHAPVSPLEGV